MQSTLKKQSGNTIRRGGIFLRLLLAGILGIFVFSFANVTYNLPTLIETLGIDPTQLPPNPVLILAATIQPTILIAIAIWVGLALSRRMGVNVTPLLSGEVKGGMRLTAGLAAGFAAGLAMLAAHQLVFLPLTGIPVNAAASMPFWAAMASVLLYGGIVEELLMRLGLMTLLLWVGSKLQRGSSAEVSNGTFWTVNIIVTIAFGLLHLVSVPSLMGFAITPLIVVQALVLNSVGLLFGWFYWRKGLETAMVAHMGVHLGYTLIYLLMI